MKKGLTEIVFILDRSGSMSGLEADTIGGYNSMLKKQKEENEGEVIISTVLFDDNTDVIHDRVDIKKVELLTARDYFVGGSTALLDAVGGAIHHISHVHKSLPDEERPEKTMFIITTDGYENASTQYSYEKVKKMVEKRKRKYHWEFIFIGANIDAAKVGGRFGVAANRTVRYQCDSVGTAVSFNVTSNLISFARNCKNAAEMESGLDAEDMLAPIQEDYQKRGHA